MLMKPHQSVYVIACGALAREIHSLKTWNQWEHMVVDYLPSLLHNHPQQIPEQVRAKLVQAQGKYDVLFVAYADCGTGGHLDRICQELGVARLPGAHCYQFFAGSKLFMQLAEQEPGTLYLTDFLAQHFERLVLQGLGIEKYPELQEMYFGRYKKLVYLAQTESPSFLKKAQSAAKKLGLVFEKHATGYGELQQSLEAIALTGKPCPS